MRDGHTAGQVVFSQKVAHDQVATEQLVIRVGKTAGEVRWAIDLTSNAAALLMAVLVVSGQQVVHVAMMRSRRRLVPSATFEGLSDCLAARGWVAGVVI